MGDWGITVDTLLLCDLGPPRWKMLPFNPCLFLPLFFFPYEFMTKSIHFLFQWLDWLVCLSSCQCFLNICLAVSRFHAIFSACWKTLQLVNLLNLSYGKPICNPTFWWSLSHPPIRIRYISSKFVHHVSQDSMRYLSAAYFWNYLLMIASVRIHCKTLIFETCLGHFLIPYFWSNIELLHLVFSKKLFVQGI